MTKLDETHDRAKKSWVESANDGRTDFPIQNLPYGAWSMDGGGERLGVAIGESILDLRACAERGLFAGLGPEVVAAMGESRLNALLALGPTAWKSARRAIFGLLAERAARHDEMLVSRAEARMHLPVEVGDYSDFYASIHHATNVGRLFRPDQPLMPNYKHLPVGYHGRASSLIVSGTSVRRPMGQTIGATATQPTFGATRLLDYEIELGFYAGPGNHRGERIAIERAEEHIFGLTLVNDWSARDVQKWEYQPLGPFNAKNFATSVGAWVVTLDALAPHRVPGPPRSADDPEPLPYLRPASEMALDVVTEVWLSSAAMRSRGESPVRVSRSNARDLYWTIAQMLAHHTSTGCNIRPGDLMASGTISGPGDEDGGCLLERTNRGERPLVLPDGTSRKFLEDGDEVILRAFCEKPGAARIGFGECRGIIEPAF